MTEKTETIDITPSWKTAAKFYLLMLEQGTDEGKEAGKRGLVEMAERFDTYIEQMSEQNEMAKNLIPQPEDAS